MTQLQVKTVSKKFGAYIPMMEEAVVEILNSLELMENVTSKALSDGLKVTGKYVISTIGLAGDKEGFITIFLPENIAIAFARQLFMDDEMNELDGEVQDAAGEITNMIVGAFKKRVQVDKEPFKISIPSVIVGSEISVNLADVDNNEMIEFTEDMGSFFVQLSLTDK